MSLNFIELPRKHVVLFGIAIFIFQGDSNHTRWGKGLSSKMQIPGQQRELVAKGFIHPTQSVTNADL